MFSFIFSVFLVLWDIFLDGMCFCVFFGTMHIQWYVICPKNPFMAQERKYWYFLKCSKCHVFLPIMFTFLYFCTAADTHGHPLIPIDIHQFPQTSIKTHGHQSIPTGTCGHPWTSTDIHEHPLISTDTYGHLWTSTNLGRTQPNLTENLLRCSQILSYWKIHSMG